jgi:hypothetical protein
LGAQNAFSLETVRVAVVREPSKAIGTHFPIRQCRPATCCIKPCKRRRKTEAKRSAWRLSAF